MSLVALVLQGNAAPSFAWYHYLLGVVLVIAAAALGYYVSKFLTGRRYRKTQKVDRQKMFDIEKALKDFWEHERRKLSDENKKLSDKITLLGKQVEEYRKKAAGVGIMGLSKDKRVDMVIQLMLENEALEEKLFELNLKIKEERDEYLAKELKNISYKRIMLSEILKEQGIQDRIRNILKDDTRLRKMELPAGRGAAPAGDDESGETEKDALADREDKPAAQESKQEKEE
jgi:hypothetical protein